MSPIARPFHFPSRSLEPSLVMVQLHEGSSIDSPLFPYSLKKEQTTYHNPQGCEKIVNPLIYQFFSMGNFISIPVFA